MGKQTGKVAVKKKIELDKETLAVLAKIEKDYGKGTVVRLGDKTRTETDVVSTGSFNLDLAIGIGGLPRGRIVEIYGPESSGKTTVLLQTIAEAQAAGGLCAIIDAEHALDLNYAEQLGVDVDNLYISQPDYGEQALEVADRLAQTRKFAVIGVDSVAALIPKKELDGEMGDATVGLHSRLMSQAMRKLTGNVSKGNTLMIFINQLRDKIGVMFGSPETTTGGNALKFYASVRLDIRRKTQKKDGEEIVGNETTVKVVKNKLAPPFRIATFDILYGRGTYYAKEIMEAAVAAEIIQKAGAWFSYGETRLGQGVDNVMTLLEDNTEMFEEIEQQVKVFYSDKAETPIVPIVTEQNKEQTQDAQTAAA